MQASPSVEHIEQKESFSWVIFLPRDMFWGQLVGILNTYMRESTVHI